MSGLGRLWAGKVYGTNTGNLFSEIDSANGGISGTLRFMDDRFGLVVYSVIGKFDGTILELKGSATKSPDDVATGEIFIKGTLTPEGEIRGQWTSSLGTGGTFLLLPHDSSNAVTRAPGNLPERLHTATRSIGTIRLYADDLEELIGILSKDFSQGRVIVTYRERGNEISRYASDFQRDMRRLGELRYLKLMIQEPEAYGINRFATVELTADGTNEVRAQGVQESWVIGKAEAISSVLRKHQKVLATTFRSFGLINFNGFLALGALIVMPELSVSRRVSFVAVITIIMWLVVQAHQRLIPNVAIYLSDRKPTAFERIWPQALSWIIAATSALGASIAYGILKGELSLPRWLVGP